MNPWIWHPECLRLVQLEAPDPQHRFSWEPTHVSYQCLFKKEQGYSAWCQHSHETFCILSTCTSCSLSRSGRTIMSNIVRNGGITTPFLVFLCVCAFVYMHTCIHCLWSGIKQLHTCKIVSLSLVYRDRTPFFMSIFPSGKKATCLAKNTTMLCTSRRRNSSAIGWSGCTACVSCRGGQPWWNFLAKSTLCTCTMAKKHQAAMVQICKILLLLRPNSKGISDCTCEVQQGQNLC